MRSAILFLGVCCGVISYSETVKTTEVTLYPAYPFSTVRDGSQIVALLDFVGGRSVADFQGDFGLTMDGVVGQQTWGAAQKLFLDRGGILNAPSPVSLKLVLEGGQLYLELTNLTTGTLRLRGAKSSPEQASGIPVKVAFGGKSKSGASFSGAQDHLVGFPSGAEVLPGETLRRLVPLAWDEAVATYRFSCSAIVSSDGGRLISQVQSEALTLSR